MGLDRSTIPSRTASCAGRSRKVENQPEGTDREPAGAGTIVDGRVPCPECGRRFQPRGLAAHRRQAHALHGLAHAQHGLGHGERSTEKDAVDVGFEALSGLVAEVTAHLVRMDLRIGRIEAALVGDAERRSRARERPTDLSELQSELDLVLAEIRTLSAALGAELPPSTEAAKPLRGRLGALRQQQAAILFRMGPSAPGGVFPPGDNALLQR
jgi:hypothetical protein